MLKRPHRLLVPAALAAAVAVAASGTLLAGCSPSQVSGCTGVSLAVHDTRTGRVTDDLHLTARLTADGRPVAGRRVNFWLYDRGPGQPPGSGVFVGTKPTDADGVARLTVVSGPAGVLTAGTTPTGFGAEKPRREDYCGASAKAGLTCGATAPAPCPAVRLTVP
ncbi:Ig-like domain-containing protein [Streptomyces sparsogenes]|uniref:Ig-like domain-containing protein n=1 Tax=Streptomyces sparsogenes TaxID=67365 RepID=UPI0033D17238